MFYDCACKKLRVVTSKAMDGHHVRSHLRGSRKLFSLVFSIFSLLQKISCNTIKIAVILGPRLPPSVRLRGAAMYKAVKGSRSTRPSQPEVLTARGPHGQRSSRPKRGPHGGERGGPVRTSRRRKGRPRGSAACIVHVCPPASATLATASVELLPRTLLEGHSTWILRERLALILCEQTVCVSMY